MSGPGREPSHPFFRVGRPNAFAHRGDRAGRPPGNRRAAFDSAVELGITHIETDAHLTADGQVVLFHDDRLDDETTLTGTVTSRTWSELAAARYVVDGNEQSDGVMRLVDALNEWPDICWNIDAKDGGVVEPLVDVIERAEASDRVLVTAFSWRRLRALRRLINGRLPTGHSRPEIVALRLLAWLRVPLPRWGDAVQLPERRRNVTVVDRRLVQSCHRAGIAVHVWTVDDERRMERLLDLGVDGLMTDHPERLRAVLRRRGEWGD